MHCKKSIEDVHMVFFYCEGEAISAEEKKPILLMIYSHKNSTVAFLCF